MAGLSMALDPCSLMLDWGRNGQDIYSTYPPTSNLIKSNTKFHLSHKPADIFCDAQNCNPTFLALGPTLTSDHFICKPARFASIRLTK